MFNWLTQRTSVQEKLDLERSSLEGEITGLQTQIGSLSLDASIGDKSAQAKLAKVQGDIALKHQRITEIDAAKEELAKRAKLAALDKQREEQQAARAKAATLHLQRIEAARKLDEALLAAEQAFIAFENTTPELAAHYRTIAAGSDTQTNLFTRRYRFIRMAFWASAPTLSGILELHRIAPRHWRPLEETVHDLPAYLEDLPDDVEQAA